MCIISNVRFCFQFASIISFSFGQQSAFENHKLFHSFCFVRFWARDSDKFILFYFFADKPKPTEDVINSNEISSALIRCDRACERISLHKSFRMWQCHKCSKPVYFGEYLSCMCAESVACKLHDFRVLHFFANTKRVQSIAISIGDSCFLTSHSLPYCYLWSGNPSCAAVRTTTTVKSMTFLWSTSRNFAIKLWLITRNFSHTDVFSCLILHYSRTKAVSGLRLASRVLAMRRMWQTIGSWTSCWTQRCSVLSCAVLRCSVRTSIVRSWHTRWVAQKFRSKRSGSTQHQQWAITVSARPFRVQIETIQSIFRHKKSWDSQSWG